LLRKSFKEHYRGPNITKDFRVLLLKITVDFPESLQNPLDVVNWEFSESWSEAITPGIPALTKQRLDYHSDYVDCAYKFSVDYGHEISEEFREIALKANGVLLQKVWNVYIQDCSFKVGTTAEELANTVDWELNSGKQELKTKVLSAKFSSSFFTKCAILSDVFINKSNEASLTDFIEYNDIGLPLAHRANLAKEIGDLDDEDLDNFDCIDETWEQLCEVLGVDKDGDFISFADMKLS